MLEFIQVSTEAKHVLIPSGREGDAFSLATAVHKVQICTHAEEIYSTKRTWKYSSVDIVYTFHINHTRTLHL